MILVFCLGYFIVSVLTEAPLITHRPGTHKHEPHNSLLIDRIRKDSIVRTNNNNDKSLQGIETEKRIRDVQYKVSNNPDESFVVVADTNDHSVKSEGGSTEIVGGDASELNSIPGESGVDYPIYSGIPRTTFTCQGKIPSAYYADIETGCQVFHVCLTDNQKNSFLCPNGSIFNQRYSVCDWWYSFDCNSAEDIYADSQNDIIKNKDGSVNEYQPDFFQNDQFVYDLNIASSGGNIDNSNYERTDENKNNLKSIQDDIQSKTNAKAEKNMPAGYRNKTRHYLDKFYKKKEHNEVKEILNDNLSSSSTFNSDNFNNEKN